MSNSREILIDITFAKIGNFSLFLGLTLLMLVFETNSEGFTYLLIFMNS